MLFWCNWCFRFSVFLTGKRDDRQQNQKSTWPKSVNIASPIWVKNTANLVFGEVIRTEKPFKCLKVLMTMSETITSSSVTPGGRLAQERLNHSNHEQTTKFNAVDCLSNLINKTNIKHKSARSCKHKTRTNTNVVKMLNKWN